MNLLLFMFCFILVMFLCSILVVFFFLMSKGFNWDVLVSSVFECGFSSWFFSRFSFSIHYFMVGLIFLFLDLELCISFPLLSSNLNSISALLDFSILVLVLVCGLLFEWKEGKLNWTY